MSPYLTLWSRAARYPGLLGTLDDVTAREMEAVDLMTWASRLPPLTREA